MRFQLQALVLSFPIAYMVLLSVLIKLIIGRYFPDHHASMYPSSIPVTDSFFSALNIPCFVTWLACEFKQSNLIRCIIYTQVALKSLIVIHRALWEVGHPFCEELVIYSQKRGHILNLSHFKDESSTKGIFSFHHFFNKC